MNIANLAFHAIQKFTAEPLAADFFEWSREETRFSNIDFSLQTCAVIVKASEPFSELKRKLSRVIEIEKRRSVNHWSFDLNRRITLDQLMSAVERFERRVQS